MPRSQLEKQALRLFMVICSHSHLNRPQQQRALLLRRQPQRCRQLLQLAAVTRHQLRVLCHDLQHVIRRKGREGELSEC